MALLSDARFAGEAPRRPARSPLWAFEIAFFLALCAVVALFPGDLAGRNLSHLGPQPNLLRSGLIGVAHNNGDRKPYLMTSADGATFHAIGGPLTSGDRDPSLTVWDGKYWMAATQLAAGATFDVWYATDPTADDWTHTVVDMSGIGTVHYTWAPEWFIDPTQVAGYQQVHILVAATVKNRLAGPFRLYEIHPLDRAMSAWSRPVEVTGTSLPTNQIDPFMVYAPEIGTPGKPFKLWYKENDRASIEYMESASLTSGYTVVESGNWAGWSHGRSIEAICLVRLDDGSWRAYFNENDGLTTVGNFYSDSLDQWATWSPRAHIETESLMSHGTYLRVASLSKEAGILSPIVNDLARLTKAPPQAERLHLSATLARMKLLLFFFVALLLIGGGMKYFGAQLPILDYPLGGFFQQPQIEVHQPNIQLP